MGTVHVVVFSNFEGWSQPDTAENCVRWFKDCSAAHPKVRWTHLYNPYHLLMGGPERPEVLATEQSFSPYLLGLQNSKLAEIGLHIHLFYDMVASMGVEPISTPFANDVSANCDTPQNPNNDQGYGVLMRGYSDEARSTILDAAINSFKSRGFSLPKTFCASYAGVDPKFQVLLAAKGFCASMSMQLPPSDSQLCWGRTIQGKFSPLSGPYRVHRDTVFPRPHSSDNYLELVEVPINLGVDATNIDLGGAVVSREVIFDEHLRLALQHDVQTAVTIGVHADAIKFETWQTGHIASVLNGFLNHVDARVEENENSVAFSTASEVAKNFL